VRLPSGLKLLEDTPGTGPGAERGDVVVFDLRETLSRGDVIGEHVRFEHALGSRTIMAGLEYTLYGMRAGGYRRVRVSPHLAYRERGVPGKVPENAVIVCEIRVREVRKPVTPGSPTA